MLMFTDRFFIFDAIVHPKCQFRFLGISKMFKRFLFSFHPLKKIKLHCIEKFIWILSIKPPVCCFIEENIKKKLKTICLYTERVWFWHWFKIFQTEDALAYFRFSTDVVLTGSFSLPVCACVFLRLFAKWNAIGDKIFLKISFQLKPEQCSRTVFQFFILWNFQFFYGFLLLLHYFIWTKRQQHIWSVQIIVAENVSNFPIFGYNWPILVSVSGLRANGRGKFGYKWRIIYRFGYD